VWLSLQGLLYCCQVALLLVETCLKGDRGGGITVIGSVVSIKLFLGQPHKFGHDLTAILLVFQPKSTHHPSRSWKEISIDLINGGEPRIDLKYVFGKVISR
jgi:hypothetical protein